MAINPVNMPGNFNLIRPGFPVRPAARPPALLDKEKTLRDNVFASDRIITGLQHLNKETHKVLEGKSEKKLYI